jgi:hypothetical protein
VVSFFQVDDKMVIGATKGVDINPAAILSQLVLFSMLFVVAFSSYLRATGEVQATNGDGT